jgi:microcystin-dependent protein
MDEYIGVIKIFAGTFAPANWAFCNGQLLSINQNTALFSIIGNMYGGDGSKSFALPNLQGQVSIGAGSGPGLTPRKIAETSNTNSYTLSTDTMPPHSHTLNGTESIASGASPANSYLGSSANNRASKKRYISGSQPTGALYEKTMNYSGNPDGAVPVATLQPYLALNYIICLYGELPQRP